MTITRKKMKSGVKYLAQVCVDGERPSKTFDTLSEAARWEEETKKRLRSGKPLEGEAAPGDMHLGEAMDRFIKSATGKSDNTIRDYRYSQTQLLKYFGEKALLSEITTPDVSQYISKRMGQDGIGASKIRAELTMIRLTYEKAVEWGVSYVSPEKLIPRPTERRKSREDKLTRVIGPEEMISLLGEAMNRPNNLYWFLLFLLYTGMRPSEAASLHWERLSSKEENALYNRKKHIGYVDLERGGFSRVGTKTESRFVPACPKAIEILNNLSRESSYVFLPDRSKLPVNNQPRDFDKQPDRPYHFFRRSFETARSRAQIDGKQIRQDIDFYSFRHTARSRMATCGIQDSAAEAIIGHADKEMQATYTHWDDSGLIDEINKLSYPWLDDITAG
jgi:integrase